jgi:ribosomal protein S14
MQKILASADTGLKKGMETDTEKPIYCRKCGKPHGVLKYGGQVFQVGNIEFYNSAKYSCICGVPVTFFASPLKDDTKSLGKNSRQVLINLGKTKKTKLKGN